MTCEFGGGAGFSNPQSSGGEALVIPVIGGGAVILTRLGGPPNGFGNRELWRRGWLLLDQAPAVPAPCLNPLPKDTRPPPKTKSPPHPTPPPRPNDELFPPQNKSPPPPPSPPKVLMYLSTPEEGGETVFPDAEFKSTGPRLSDCARKGLANKPFKGDGGRWGLGFRPAPGALGSILEGVCLRARRLWGPGGYAAPFPLPPIPSPAVPFPHSRALPCHFLSTPFPPSSPPALLFYSLTPDGKEDPKSLHGSCPTTKGWAAGGSVCFYCMGGAPRPRRARRGARARCCVFPRSGRPLVPGRRLGRGLCRGRSAPPPWKTRPRAPPLKKAPFPTEVPDLPPLPSCPAPQTTLRRGKLKPTNRTPPFAGRSGAPPNGSTSTPTAAPPRSKRPNGGIAW